MRKMKFYLFLLIIALFTACTDKQKETSENFTVYFAPSQAKVSVNSSLVLTFSQLLDKKTINTDTIYIEDKNSNKIDIILTVEDATLKIAPSSNLKLNEKYSLIVTTNIQNKEGFSLSKEFKWSFFTLSLDIKPPAIKSILPSSLTDITTNIIIEFDELLDTTKIELNSLLLKDDKNNSVEGEFGYNDQWVWFTPSTNLKKDTGYTLSLEKPIYDLSSNIFKGETSFNFKTNDFLLNDGNFSKSIDKLSLNIKSYSLFVENNSTVYIGSHNKLSKISTSNDSNVRELKLQKTKENELFGTIYDIATVTIQDNCPSYNSLVLATDKGIRIVNNDDLSLTSSIDLKDDSFGVDVVCNSSNSQIYAYVANANNGIKVFNITDKNSIKTVNSFALKGTLFDIVKKYNKIYTASYNNGLNVYDNNGSLLQHFETQSTARSLSFYKNMLVVSDATVGISRFQIDTQGVLSPLLSTQSLSTVIKSYINDKNIFALTTTKGISIISQEKPQKIAYQIPSSKRLISLGADESSLYTLSIDGILSSYILNPVVEIVTVSKIIPTLEPLTTSINENVSTGTEIASIKILNSGDSPITSFSLSGNGHENFIIDTMGKITLADNISLDYETTSKYNLLATATNSAGESSSVPITLSLQDYINPFLIAKFQADDRRDNGYFGSCVDIDNEYMVVASHNSNYYSSDGSSIEHNQESVYLYKKDKDAKVKLIAKIQANDTDKHTNFGYSVSISGDYIVVGVPFEYIDGQAQATTYIFKRDSDNKDDITQIAKLQSNDNQTYSTFGYSTAISGEYIAIGKPFEYNDGNNSGSVYLFKIDLMSENNITQIAHLKSKDDYFGSAISLDGDYIAVGTPFYSYSEDEKTGNVSIFKRKSDDINDTIQIAKIEPNDSVGNSNFGELVSLDKNYVAIASPQNGDSSTGSAYLFKINSDDINDTTQIAKIQPQDLDIHDKFGWAISLSNNYLLVSAFLTQENQSATYLFKREDNNTITQIKKIQAFDTKGDDKFGLNSASISGNNIIIGASQSDAGGKNMGTTYLFDLEPINKPYIYNTAPIIYYNEQFSNNFFFNIYAQTPNNSNIFFEVTGEDEYDFQFLENNLSFIQIADFENPEDENQDNNYNITISAIDEKNHREEINSTIIVQDKQFLKIKEIEKMEKDGKNYFAVSTAISGNYFIVSSLAEYETDSTTETVFLYKIETDKTITQIAELKADTEEIQYFGYSLAIDDKYIAIGAYKKDSDKVDTGAVYLYKRNSDAINDTTLIAKLTADDAKENDYFGSSIAMDNEYIIVGANGEDSDGENSGAVYLFKRNSDDSNGTVKIAKLKADNVQEFDNFGLSLAIHNDYMVIGAKSEVAYLFKRNSDNRDDTTQIAILKADDTQINDYFGSSVSIFDDYIVIGAYGEDSAGDDAGTAYLFKRNSDDRDDTTQILKIQPTVNQKYRYFGSSVALNSNFIVIGSPVRYNNETSIYGNNIEYLRDSYIFNLNKTIPERVTQVDSIQANLNRANNNFGSSVSIDGDYILIANPSKDNNSDYIGSVDILIKDENQH